MTPPTGSGLPGSPFLGQSQRPRHGTVVIEVRGGCVVCVSSDVDDIDVVVIDYDEDEETTTQEPDKATYPYELWA